MDPQLLFGLDSQLFLDPDSHGAGNHHDEVETMTVLKGHDESLHNRDRTSEQHSPVLNTPELSETLSRDRLTQLLDALSTETVWRVKGYVRMEGEVFILNWAFGRFNLLTVDGSILSSSVSIKMTCMGERGELKKGITKLVHSLGARIL